MSAIDPTDPTAAPADPSSDPGAPTPPGPTPDPAAPTPPDPSSDPAAPTPPDATADPASPAPSSDSEYQSVEGQLATMRAQLEDLQAKAASGQLARQPVDEDLSARVKQLREAFADWPQKGDSQFADQPQPYELQAHGLPQPGVTRDHLPPGEPDSISPVVISHSLPIIGPGQAGHPVSLLARLLGKLGYPTTISRGQNHTFSFDESVAQAVETFKREWHVVEDSSAFRTAEEASRIVGPWIWEALLRATHTAL